MGIKIGEKLFFQKYLLFFWQKNMRKKVMRFGTKLLSSQR